MRHVLDLVAVGCFDLGSKFAVRLSWTGGHTDRAAEVHASLTRRFEHGHCLLQGSCVRIPSFSHNYANGQDVLRLSNDRLQNQIRAVYGPS